MKITITDGNEKAHHFDTEKARKSFSPSYWDGHNRHYAELYLSSTGKLYGNGLSQWSNMHGSFEIMTADEALQRYGNALNDEAKAEIAKLGGIEWE